MCTFEELKINVDLCQFAAKTLCFKNAVYLHL